jgi:1-acyl-sn-glycerol-3-phosphate acyltransferase
MIIKAKHHWFNYTIFKIYAVYKIRRNFNKAIINGDYHDNGLPVLLLSNHLSWWDGFWAMYVNLKLLKRRFHFMMLEEQLKRYSFFIHVGGYSVKNRARSLVESINYTAELLCDNRNMVLLFPQGRITSIYDQTFIFGKGVEYILRKVEGKVQIIFMANLVDYFSNEKPSLFIYLKEYKPSEYKTEKIQEEYNRFYSECITVNINKSDN